MRQSSAESASVTAYSAVCESACHGAHVPPAPLPHPRHQQNPVDPRSSCAAATIRAETDSRAARQDTGPACLRGPPRSCRSSSPRLGRAQRCRAAALLQTTRLVSLRSRVARGEPVAGTAYRLNEAIVPESFQRFAQAADMHVDGALLDVHVAAPDTVEQLVTGVNPLRVSH